jgi:hypothetical protein
MPPFQGGCHLFTVHQFAALLELPPSTVSAVIVESLRSNNGSAVKWQATQAHRRGALKRVTCKNNLSSVATLTTEFQTASGSNISTITVRRELHEMDLQAAAHKPKITMCNAKHWLEWCNAHNQWTLKQWKLAVRLQILFWRMA